MQDWLLDWIGSGIVGEIDVSILSHSLISFSHIRLIHSVLVHCTFWIPSFLLECSGVVVSPLPRCPLWMRCLIGVRCQGRALQLLCHSNRRDACLVVWLVILNGCMINLALEPCVVRFMSMMDNKMTCV